MFNRRFDHFEKKEKENIQSILKKKENKSFIRTEYKFNVVLQLRYNIGWFVIFQD